ncbi:MAG TPA: glycoside hydrolase family 3 N-terminal domain-containing protein [Spirillospora sp.]|nr:glycoside hydrolase family 3 N-terminal domain-containing protein [Spirillospora sp.]
MTVTDRPWTDPSLPRDERLGLLLAAMTLEEKVAQLGSAWRKYDGVVNLAPRQHMHIRTEPYEQVRRHGLGHLSRVFGSTPSEPGDAAAALADLQKDLMENTRLGIPAIAHEECLTGFTTYRASIFPTPLAWAASFDPDLVQEMAAAIGEGMHDVGVHQGLAPVLDVVRDYRWGRVEETLGEDPYLVGVLGAAYVRGLQNAGVSATLKHFAGYSATEAGRNQAPAHLGPRELREIITLPFEMAIAAGAQSVMNAYNEIDGVPVAADRRLLTQLLRHELGFTGTVVSDYWAVTYLETTHRVAGSQADAAALALQAGIDVELPDTRAYGHLLQCVRDGTVPESCVDTAVLRVLGQKLDLGLLDADWSPGPPLPREGTVDLDPPRNRALARTLAERSVVLLANPAGVLPLTRPPAAIALIGPCADDVNALFGCYAFPNFVLVSFSGHDLGIDALTIRQALDAALPDSHITFQPGCAAAGTDRDGIGAAAEAAAQAELCILTVGDRSGMLDGTSGEGRDVEDLSLPGVQGELIEAVLATGTPTILVVVSGRPYALGTYADRCAAVVQAFLPGEEGATALADVLTGRVNPSGRLPTQIPHRPGVNPSTYLHPPLAEHTGDISRLDPTPLYPFGHGLSYTTFEYGDTQTDKSTLEVDAALTVTTTVTNTGDCSGTEVVQLYYTDPVAAVTRPVRQLLGFARVTLDPGQRADVHFDVHTDRFAHVTADLTRIVEPGAIELHIGRSSTDIHATMTVELTGLARVVTHDRQLLTPARITQSEGPS